MRRYFAGLFVFILTLVSNPSFAGSSKSGSLDPTFGRKGKVTTDFIGGPDSIHGIAIQSDGKIVAVGMASDYGGGTMFFALARYNADGSLDTSFGSGGKVSIPGGTSLTAVTIQPDGKIVATGELPTVVLRCLPNGSLDPSFGTAGIVTSDLDGFFALALQSDGKIIAAGQDAVGPDFAIARYHPDGSPDSTFGSGGEVITAFPGQSAAEGIIIQPDGKIVAVGFSPGPGGGDFAMARYNPDGSLDTSFGTGGTVTTDFGGGWDIADSVVLQIDGKIVLAGVSQVSTIHDFALARYNSDGSLDTSFGTDGKVTTNINPTVGNSEALALALQTDGKLVAAGYSIPASRGIDFAVARYNSDGSLDVGFGNGGTVTTDFGHAEDFAYAVALQADGKIIAAGSDHVSKAGDNTDFALACYLP